MYTYIYTEKHMNFYRTGKVIGLTGGQEFLLDSSAYKHKAVYFPNQTTATNQIRLKFYNTDGGAEGVTLTVPAVSTGVQTACIFPGVVKTLLATSTTEVVLLS